MRNYLAAFPAIAWLALTGVSRLYAQDQAPVIRADSVVNAASQIPPGLPNYGVAQGSMFILRGQGLASGTPPITVANSPLPLTLAGASMQIAVAGAKVDVPMVYAAGDRLAGIVPSTTPAGEGTITVILNGRSSAPAPITIVPRAFGIFTLSQTGFGPGFFISPDLAFDTPMARRLIGVFPHDPAFGGNSLVAAAHPGDPLVMWGTGLGPMDVPVEVYVGNVRADVTSQGRASCCSGVDQIQFTVPPGVEGCYVPVAVKIGAAVSNFATISISPDGSVCSDPGGWSASDLQSSPNGVPVNIADILLFRFMGKFSLPGLGTLQGAVDFGQGQFRRYSGPPLGVLASIRGVGPSSGCLALPFTSNGTLFDNLIVAPDDLPGVVQVDAGAALNIAGPLGPMQIPRNKDRAAWYPSSLLGGGLPPLIPPGAPEYLVPGSYTVDNGSGGPDVKAFSATLTIPSDRASWTGQDAISNIRRSQDLTIAWSGSGSVAIIGSSQNPAAGVGAQFSCVAGDADNGTFTVPAWVLSTLPASGTASDIPAPLGFLSVATLLADPTRFQAPGIDIGYFNWTVVQIKNVNYQ